LRNLIYAHGGWGCGPKEVAEGTSRQELAIVTFRGGAGGGSEENIASGQIDTVLWQRPETTSRKGPLMPS